MNEIFGSIYTDAYDLLYQDKSYIAECDLLRHVFQVHGVGEIRDVLDLGCGTGNHAISLAEWGYEVVGIERSREMLAQARKKAACRSPGNGVTFHEGDIRKINLQQKFDVALMMFAVLGYQLTNPDVFSTLKAARQHLRPGGLLIFDVWYGPAVLRQRPSQRIKVIRTPAGRILRVASGKIDTRRHLCVVYFYVWRLEGERLVAETEETHPVRYFFPLELEFLLESSGFTLIRLGAFPKFDQEPDETTWNVLGVAQAK